MSYLCNSRGCRHLTWITHPVCLSGSSLDYFFYLRTEEDNVSFLPMCLCRSWLQMHLCRGSLDLRRAVAGVLVRTALGVAYSWTLKAVASPHWLFKSPLYISLSGMTWTQCQSLVCGQYCPTLTCHISWVVPVCAGLKGNLWDSLKFPHFSHVIYFPGIGFVALQTALFTNCNQWRNVFVLSKKLTKKVTWCVSFVSSDWRGGCFSLCLQ